MLLCEFILCGGYWNSSSGNDLENDPSTVFNECTINKHVVAISVN